MARNCKASNALCTLVKREKEVFRSRRKLSAERNGSRSSRPPGRPQTRPDDRTLASRYEQLMAAGGPQMLATSDLCTLCYYSHDYALADCRVQCVHSGRLMHVSWVLTPRRRRAYECQRRFIVENGLLNFTSIVSVVTS